MTPPKRRCVHMPTDIAAVVEDFPGQNAIQITPYKLTPDSLGKGPYRTRQGTPLLIEVRNTKIDNSIHGIINSAVDIYGQPMPFRIWTTEGWNYYKQGNNDANVHLTIYAFRGGDPHTLYEVDSIHTYLENKKDLEAAIRLFNRQLPKDKNLQNEGISVALNC